MNKKHRTSEYFHFLKCLISSTCPKGRRGILRDIWKELGADIDVLTGLQEDFRDPLAEADVRNKIARILERYHLNSDGLKLNADMLDHILATMKAQQGRIDKDTAKLQQQWSDSNSGEDDPKFKRIKDSVSLSKKMTYLAKMVTDARGRVAGLRKH
jgi:ABC-type phosphate transport system auxiliary subunit